MHMDQPVVRGACCVWYCSVVQCSVVQYDVQICNYVGCRLQAVGCRLQNLVNDSRYIYYIQRERQGGGRVKQLTYIHMYSCCCRFQVGNPRKETSPSEYCNCGYSLVGTTRPPPSRKFEPDHIVVGGGQLGLGGEKREEKREREKRKEESKVAMGRLFGRLSSRVQVVQLVRVQVWQVRGVGLVNRSRQAGILVSDTSS